MEKTANAAPKNPEVLYDLVVIRTASGKLNEAVEALKKTIELNPKLKEQAKGDNAIGELKKLDSFK